MKIAIYTLLEQENYIREKNLTKLFTLNMFCCKINFYKNLKHYFDCHCFCY